LSSLPGTTEVARFGPNKGFAESGQWLQDLAKKDFIAVRLGVLKFRGFKLNKVPATGGTALTDADFSPDFEQKGVDMRIGLDIATYSTLNSVDRIGLVTADTDCVPAMKHARKSGVQVILIALPDAIVPHRTSPACRSGEKCCLARVGLQTRFPTMPATRTFIRVHFGVTSCRLLKNR